MRTVVVKTVNALTVGEKTTALAGKKGKINALLTTNLVIDAEGRAIFVQFVDPKSNRGHPMKLRITTKVIIIRLVLGGSQVQACCPSLLLSRHAVPFLPCHICYMNSSNG